MVFPTARAEPINSNRVLHARAIISRTRWTYTYRKPLTLRSSDSRTKITWSGCVRENRSLENENGPKWPVNDGWWFGQFAEKPQIPRRSGGARCRAENVANGGNGGGRGIRTLATVLTVDGLAIRCITTLPSLRRGDGGGLPTACPSIATAGHCQSHRVRASRLLRSSFRPHFTAS